MLIRELIMKSFVKHLRRSDCMRNQGSTVVEGTKSRKLEEAPKRVWIRKEVRHWGVKVVRKQSDFKMNFNLLVKIQGWFKLNSKNHEYLTWVKNLDNKDNTEIGETHHQIKEIKWIHLFEALLQEDQLSSLTFLQKPVVKSTWINLLKATKEFN